MFALVFLQLVDDVTDRDTSMGGTQSGDDARESDAGAVMHNKKLGVDPFNSEESDPAKCNAMRKFLPQDTDAYIG